MAKQFARIPGWLPPEGAVTIPAYPSIVWGGPQVGWTYNGQPYNPSMTGGTNVTLQAIGVGPYAGAYYTGTPGVDGAWMVPQEGVAAAGSIQQVAGAAPVSVQQGANPFGNGAASGGGGSNISPQIAQLLLGQQGAAAAATITGPAVTQVAAASDEFAAGAASMALIQGIALQLGVSTGAAGGGTSQMQLLISLMGTTGLAQVATAIATYNVTAHAPGGASFAALNLAYDAFITSFKSALASINNNAMITGILANGGSMNAILGIMLAQNALAAFNTQAVTTGAATAAAFKSAVAALASAWNTLASAMSTNALLSSLSSE